MSKPEQVQQETSKGIEIDGQAEIIDESGRARTALPRLALGLSLLSLIAIAVALTLGYRYWGGMRSSLEQLDAALAQAGQEQRQMSEQLAQTQQAFLQQQQKIAAQAQLLEQQRGQLETEREELRQQGLQMNRSLADMQQRLGNEKSQWRVAEAEYLIRLANHRLALMHDPLTALEALKSADQRLRDTSDPGWGGVREVLAKEILALEAVPGVDRDGLFARLGALAEQIERLPLRDEGVRLQARNSDNGGRDGESAASDEPGLDLRAMLRDLWEGFKSMVVIRHHAQPISAMLPPEQRYFLGQNLRLKLEAAKAALLGGNGKLYRESLNASLAWVERYFEAGSPQVQGFIGQARELAGEQIAPDMPDISASLRALQKRREELLQGGAQ